MSDSFSKSIVLSLAAHFALVIALVMRAVFIPDQAIDLREAIRVDVVGLPEKEQQLPDKPVVEAKPTPPTPPAAKPEPVKPKPAPPPPKAPTVDLSKKGKKVDVAKMQKKALQEIKAMSALDKIREEVSNQPVTKPKPVRGNTVSAGNSLTGLEKIDFDRYFSEIESKVRQNWSLPQWLIDAGFRAQALVLIDETGAIKEKKIVKSSGNAEFDQRVLETLDHSGPFTPPPERLRDVLSVKGIIFNFPQRGTDT